MVDLDVDKICRVCLRTNLELSLLFDEQNAVDGVCLSEMITECTMYMVRRHDEFPHLICYDCIDKVQSAYCFKKQFETSHRKLICLLDSVNNVTVDTRPSVANDKCTQTEESTMYPCEKCDEKFVNYESLREHRLNSHKGTANLCRVCLKTFNRIGDLKNHIAICHPEIGYTTANECAICNKKFTRKDHVTRHMRNIHKLGLDDAEDDGSEMKPEEIENLVETEIEYGNLTKQEVDTELISNYDRTDYDDNINESPEFEATNPFSSYDDEKPLDSALTTVKLEPQDEPNMISLHAMKSEDQDFENNENKKFTRKDHAARHMRNVHKLGLDDAQDDGTSEMKPDEIENLIETEIVYGSVTKEELDIELSSNYDPTDYDDNISESPEFGATNSFSSEDDEKPLSHLLTARNADAKDSAPITIKFEPQDEPNMISLDTLKSEDQDSENNEKPSSAPLQESTKRKYKCPECDKAFTRSSHVKRHLMSHRQEKPFPCTVCNKRFSRADRLKMHLIQHDTDKPYQCDSCDLSNARPDLQRCQHTLCQRVKPYQCTICQKRFGRPDNLKVHMSNHGQKHFQCTACDRSFARAYLLKRHMDETHSEDKPFLCSQCGKRFVRNGDLAVHMRRHSGEKPYKCQYCNKRFAVSTEKYRHESYHTGEKKHVCSICGKAFQRPYNLLVHVRTHTGERPYKCPHCPKNFAQIGDLKAHIRRHTGERYRCDQCEMGFIHVFLLNQHKFSVHGIEVESKIRRVAKVNTDTP